MSVCRLTSRIVGCGKLAVEGSVRINHPCGISPPASINYLGADDTHLPTWKGVLVFCHVP